MLHHVRRGKWSTIAYVASGLALVATAFVSGCSGGSLASHASMPGPSSSPAASSGPLVTAAPAVAQAACSRPATLPPQTLSGSGGTLTIPACGPFSGTLTYPSFGGNDGTISATLVTSMHNDIGSAEGVASSGTLLYIGLTLTSSNAADSAVTFGALGATASADCGEIAGAFTSGTTYYAQGEFPFSAGVNTQTMQSAAGTDTFHSAGCTLGGESLTLGKRNFILIGTSPS